MMSVAACRLCPFIVSNSLKCRSAILRLPRRLQTSRTLSSTNYDYPTTDLSNRSFKLKETLRNWVLKISYLERDSKKADLRVAAQRLYICMLHYIEFDQFRQDFGLDDSFASWVKVVQLHAWMLMLRLNNHRQSTSENKTFSFLRTEFNKSMWRDLEMRAKKISNHVNYKDGLYALGDLYITASFEYNDSWVQGDQAFMEALKKNILEVNKSVSHSQLERLVFYVDKNVNNLQQLSDQSLLIGYATFISIHREKSDLVKDKKVLEYIQQLE